MTASTPRGALILTMLVAAVLRGWGLDFGLPSVLAHPDESRVAGTAVGFLSGSLHPGFFNYPTLFLYATGLLDWGWCAARVATGGFDSVEVCAASWPSAWKPFFLTARIISAVSGTATVALVFFLGRRLFGTAAGLASALLLATAFLHVRDSHFGVTDVAMTSLVVASLRLLVRAHDAPSAAGFAVAGLVAGLATSTKYNGAFLALPAVVSGVLAWRERRPLAGARVLLFGSMMAIGFFAGTPYAALDFERFWTDASAEAEHLEIGHGIHVGVGWRHHLLVTLRYGLTLPLLGAALAGALLVAWRDPRRAALLLAFPLVYYAVAGSGHTVFARYMVPIVPFACLTAGYTIGQLHRALARRQPAGPAAVLALAAAIGLAAPGAYKSAHLGRLLARTDSRVLAADWLRARVAPGESVYATGSHYGRPDLYDRGRPPAFSVLKYDDAAAVFRAPDGRAIEHPDWLVVQESPLVIYSSVPEVITRRLPQYDLVQTFRAQRMGEPRVYDQQDAWYLPLAGFRGISRPGPNLSVYRLRR